MPAYISLTAVSIPLPGQIFLQRDVPGLELFRGYRPDAFQKNQLEIVEKPGEWF